MKPDQFAEDRSYLHCNKLLIILLTLLVFLYANTTAQTLVGSGQTYTTLKSAFDAINNGALTGEVVIHLTSSTTETATASLNASGSGSASYTSVTIYPTGSGYSINGNLSAPLITLNGADNVTIDGRVNQSGNKNLVITNSNTGTASETSTLCLQNSAENNIIKYCHLRGSTGCTTAGIVFFSTSSSGNGNDNNRIEYCDITKEGTTGALCAVYSKGNSGYVNSGNIITGNEIYDVMRNDATYMGICIYYYSDAWTVSANSFFETMSRLMTASATSYFIYVNTINGSYKTGSSFYISANYMGGTAPQCGGSSLSIDANGTSYSMYGIYITNDTNVTSVQENTIRNITITRSGISGDFFNGIYLLEGKFEVGTSSRNYVGESSGNSSITISGSSTSVYKSRGIYFKGSGISSANISNNVIGSINATGSESGPHAFWGIYYENSNENNIYAKSYILNNQIGSTVTSKSILLTNRSNASGNAVELGGIWNVSWSHLTVTGNTIFNLYNNDSSNTYSFTYGMKNTWYGYYNVRNNIIGNITTTSKRQHAQPNQYIITGILHEAAYTATSDTIFICDNKVFGIYSLYNGSVNSYISGMYFVNYWYPNITKISGNLFYNLSLEATGSDSRIIGIEFGSCSESNKWYVFNNVINLGKGVNKNCEIYGIYLNGQGKDSLFINNNSVYIGGSAITPWNASTYCIRQVWDYFSPSTYKLVLMNNVFYNARSNPDPGNSAKHYAITFWSSNMKIDYNDYYAPGTGGVMAHVGADYNTLSGLKAVTLQDNYSVNDNPYFLTDSTLKIDSTNSGCWNVYKKGTQIQNITSDYRGLPRSNSVLNGSVCIGANEFTTLTTPPVAIASGAPSSGGTTYYSQSNRRLFEIIWGASLKKPESGGKTKKNSGKSSSYKSQDRTLPSTVSLQYYSGQTPPDTANIPVAKIGKGYYFIDTDRDPANSFSVKVYWGDHELGNITDTSKIILAMYDIKRKYWIPFYRGFSGNNVSIVDHSAKTLTVNGLTRIDNVRFAFTDKDQPLLSSSMAGDYTVGVSTEGNYTTLTSALNEVKIRGISGAVRFLLIDTLYSSDETFPLIIDSIPGTSQTNSLTLKPNTGVLSVISGNNEGGILELNHCKYIIIDGSNEGKGKNLTIKNSSTSDTGGVTICLKNDASNNTIINCNIIGSSFSTNGIISFSDSTITTGCCNNKIENCSIYGGNSATTYGIVLTGNILKYGENNKILRNEIYDFSYCGISCDFFINTEIRGNNIYQTRTYSNETIYGIVLQYECKNTTISGNKICNFRSSQSYPNYYGILINSAGDTINIIN